MDMRIVTNRLVNEVTTVQSFIMQTGKANPGAGTTEKTK